MNILILMAGLGSRFNNSEFKNPKPLIIFNGKPMVQHVIERLGVNNNPAFKHIFVCQKSHINEFQLHDFFSSFVVNFEIVEVDGLTEGAACSALIAKTLIDNDEELLIINSDQLPTWDPTEIFYLKEQGQIFDGLVYCFHGNGPKWSYVKLDGNNYINEVAEKIQISDLATLGLYFWAKGKDFVWCAEEMIRQNIRVNNEFYIAPVYNEGIKNNLKFIVSLSAKSIQIGTPEELNLFLKEEKSYHGA